jgi:3-methyladenine DNA glycosylase AlkD
MTVDEALAALKAKADPQWHAMNLRKGAGTAQFGVKMGDIRAIAKQIKSDPPLGLALWATGNVDARFLAILLLKPKALALAEVEALLRSNDFVPVSDWFNSYVLKAHPDKEALRERFMDDPQPMAARAGWSLTAERVEKAPAGLDLAALLDRLAAEMPGADPVVQWTMNNTLAAIGIHHPAHRARVLEMGEAMGIFRDYPTPRGCTSPFVPLWVGEMVRRGA